MSNKLKKLFWIVVLLLLVKTIATALNSEGFSTSSKNFSNCNILSFLFTGKNHSNSQVFLLLIRTTAITLFLRVFYSPILQVFLDYHVNDCCYLSSMFLAQRKITLTKYSVMNKMEAKYNGYHIQEMAMHLWFVSTFNS